MAEASLANRRAQINNTNSGLKARETDDENPKLGVASDNYFKPGMVVFSRVNLPITFTIGPMTILPLRRLYIERQVQPEMLSFVSTEEVVDLFNM